MKRAAASTLFWAGAFGLGLAILAAERLVLALAFSGDGGAIPRGEIAGSFLHGLRFDASGLAWPFALAVLVTTGIGMLRRSDGGAVRGAAAVLAFVAILCAIDVPFFAEFRARLDFVALEYLDDPGAALGLATASVGVGGIALAAAAVAAATWLAVRALRRLRSATFGDAAVRPSALGAVVVLAALVVAARGGFGRPLRPQDAARSSHAFVNQLDLSAPFTIERHLYEWLTDRDVTLESWGEIDESAALAHLVFDTDDAPVTGHPTLRTTPFLPRAKPRNVVLILEESFAAGRVGALRGGDDSWTPHFDRLTARGTLGTNFWASGPSTNRALPAVFASIPSLPQRLSVTKSSIGQQRFLSLPRLLGERGYDSAFLCGGASEWENLGGWLRQQGFARIIDRAAFTEAERASEWGPPDHVLFDRMLTECDAMAARGPFLVSVLTTVNHPPFPVPAEAPCGVPGGATDRERAMRYADAALGRFMDAALARPWAADTLFVILGDHGFHGIDGPPRATIEPDRHHVPILWIGDGIAAGARDGRTASQVDLLPTIVGLAVGGEIRHASWGRALPLAERVPSGHVNRGAGYAVLGPHGGDASFAIVDGSGDYVVSRVRAQRGETPRRAFRWDAATRTLTPAEPTDDSADDPADGVPDEFLDGIARGWMKAAHRVLLSRTAAPE